MSFFQDSNHLEISGGAFYAAQRDVIFHYYPPTGSNHGNTPPREVDSWVANFLLQSLRLSLEWGTLDGDSVFTILIDWNNLPKDFAIGFPQPAVVEYRQKTFAKAHIDPRTRVTANSRKVAVGFTITNEAAFTLFASAVVHDEEIQVVLKADQLRLFTGSSDSGSDYTLHKTFTVKSHSRFHELISVNNFKLRGSDADGTSLKVTTTVEITNRIHVSIKVAPLTVGAYYRGMRIGIAEIEEHILRQGSNIKDVNWKFQDPDNIHENLDRFFSHYLCSADKIPVSFKVERMTVNICGSSYDFSGLEISSILEGVGMNIVTRLYARASLWRIMRTNCLSAQFTYVNTTDTTVQIEYVDAVACLQGVTVLKAKHTLESFIIPAGQEADSELIPTVSLTVPLSQAMDLLMTNYGGTVDLKILTSRVRIGKYILHLTAEFKHVPFRLTQSVF